MENEPSTAQTPSIAAAPVRRIARPFGARNCAEISASAAPATQAATKSTLPLVSSPSPSPWMIAR